MSNWAIAVGIGLGHLLFGMPPDETAAFGEIYGEATSQADEASASGSVIDVLLEQMPASPERDELVASLRAESAGKVSQSLGDGRVVLSFMDGRLQEITLGAEARNVQFEGLLLFVAPEREVVEDLALRDPGARIAEDDIRYPALGIALYGFAELTAQRGISFPPVPNPERAVVLYQPDKAAALDAPYQLLTKFLK
ncbi:hypothetical protein JMK10_16850 [Rhodovulum sulfidophilum]|uniref:hypothetical protein n=1 Tax=Rhodovulum sulfidophilum TaxID=35806 RepID=UPI00192241C3|nr:hypothetical protein [Rhodovulum sulfidophilum]MBL3573373.1 hypothetical protein [Rhodovulum sulfidophilum]MCE8432958.1 hypothetical protein [Rhodovulum sulfidophilum]MCF4118430.1 hypothetical protein [Rhodovulum sulfidophilum]